MALHIPSPSNIEPDHDQSMKRLRGDLSTAVTIKCSLVCQTQNCHNMYSARQLIHPVNISFDRVKQYKNRNKVILGTEITCNFLNKLIEYTQLQGFVRVSNSVLK